MPGEEIHYVLYSNIHKVFSQLNDEYLENTKIGIPLIGCGIAGGSWEKVKEIIENAAPNLDITAVHYSP